MLMYLEQQYNDNRDSMLRHLKDSQPPLFLVKKLILRKINSPLRSQTNKGRAGM